MLRARVLLAILAGILVLAYGFDSAWSSASAALDGERRRPAAQRYAGLAGRYRAGQRVGYYFHGRADSWMNHWLRLQFEIAPAELDLCRGRSGLVEDLFAGKEVLAESDRPEDLDALERELGILGAPVGLRPAFLRFRTTLASITAERLGPSR